jgi:metal-dependent amidase/aminoacylase/carboxypeptidase family protein
MRMSDRDWYRENLAEVIGWRRDFHRLPEIGFQEQLTSR